MPSKVKVFIREQQVSAPYDIASAADMYMTARKEIKGKVPTSDKQADKPSSPPSIKSYATPNKHQQTPREKHCNHSSTPPSTWMTW